MPSGTDTFGYWLDMAGRWPVLPKDQVLRLAGIIQNPESSDIQRNRAIDKLVRHNLRLIPKIVRRCTLHKRSFTFGDVNCEDLLQAGTIGLRRAAELYDPKRGYAFSTYAMPWIYQSVQSDIYENISTIRVPETTLRELYSAMHQDEDMHFTDLKPHKRQRLHDALRAIRGLSTDSKHGDPDKTNFVDCLSDANRITETGIPVSTSSQDDINDICNGKKFQEIINIPAITDLQRRLLTMLYEENSTKKEAQDELGLTSQRLDTQLKRSLKTLKSVLS
jgi:RNA polymerase sigma factor (sigma-70 family)